MHHSWPCDGQPAMADQRPTSGQQARWSTGNQPKTNLKII